MVKEGLFSKETTTIIYLHIAGEVLEVTPEHPFLVNGEWLTADKLTTYHKLTLYNGTTTAIEKKETVKLATPKKVYNFAVQGYNSYFVGESRVLVHNCKIPANGGSLKKHGGTNHNDRIDNLVDKLKADPKVKNIRKNQAQVDVDGNKVGNNRPDVQFDKDNVHTNVEYDTKTTSMNKHKKQVPANDPKARNKFYKVKN